MIHGVVARRGIQAIELTHENRFRLTDLVGGRLHQHGEIDKASGRIGGYRYRIEFTRNGVHYEIHDGQWMVISPEGFVAIMDPDTFNAWFETVTLTDALSASVSPQNDPGRS